MDQQGGVKSQEPGVVSASRKQENNPTTNNTEIDIFLNTIYTFKSDIWPLFLGTLQSQDQSVISRYTEFLSQIYNCIIENTECNSLLHRYYKNDGDIVEIFIKKMRLYQNNNNVPRQTFEYYLKQNLLVCQFVYNFKAQKQCTENKQKELLEIS